MTDFNTGNPIGSTDPRDLSDNAEAFDRAINDTSSPTWLDRFGNARTTLAGQIGFIGTGVDGAIEDYASGQVLSTYNTIIRYSGELYGPSASATLPYTTTATLPDADPNLVARGDLVVRQDLAEAPSIAGKGVLLVSGAVHRVASRTEMKGYNVNAGYQFSLDEGGRSCPFVVRDAAGAGFLIIKSVTSSSVNATSDTITSTAHGLVNGDGVKPTTSVNGLTAGQLYWVVGATANTFQLSLSYGGAAFDLTGTTNFTVNHMLDPLEGVFILLDNGNYAMRLYDGISSEGGVNASWFGAVGDGVANDTGALQAAIDHATYRLFIPEGNFITSDALVVDKQLSLFGAGSERTSGQGTQIRNEGINEGLIYSDTVGIYDRTIKDIGITSVNGHGLHLRYGCVRCEFLNVRADSRSIDHSAIFGDYTSYGIGLFTNRFIGGEYIGANTVNRNVPIVDLKTSGTLINENVFRDMWVSYSKGIMAMRVQATGVGVKLTNNKFESITYEVCEGGLLRLSQCAHTKIDGISAWDSPSYTGNLVVLDDCTNTTVIGYGRIGGTPDAGVRDIVQQSGGGGLTVISFSDVGAIDEAIDWGGRTGTYIGAFSATRVDLNADRVVFIEGDNVKAPNVLSPNHTAADGADAFLRATGDATARLSSEHTGVTRTVSLDANAFYGGSGAWRPDADGVLDLGGTSLRWKNVHAVGYRANGSAGVSGSFTSADSKTVTVTNGIITNIV